MVQTSEERGSNGKDLLSLRVGIIGRAVSVDVNGQENTNQKNKCQMYFVAKPFRALKVSSKILESAQYL